MNDMNLGSISILGDVLTGTIKKLCAQDNVVQLELAKSGQ